MQDNKIIVCNNCKEKIITNSNKKVLLCPYCGSNNIAYVDDDTNEKRTLFGVKVDTNQINDKLLWILFGIVVIALFAFLFFMKK